MLAGKDGGALGRDAANERTQQAQSASTERASGEYTPIERATEQTNVASAPVEQAVAEYASLEAAEIAETLEKDSRLLVFGEDRLLFLADAVFAIAMTLLVLEINLPAGHLPDEGAFNGALATLVAQTAVYLITFAVLTRYWIEHRSMMRLVDRLDRPVIWLTFLFLAFVAFFPVSSGIVGDYDYAGAVALFTLALVGCGYSLLGIWLYVSGKNRLLGAPVSRQAIADRSVDLALAPTVFFLSLALLVTGRFDPSPIFFAWLLVIPLGGLISYLRGCRGARSTDMMPTCADTQNRRARWRPAQSGLVAIWPQGATSFSALGEGARIRWV
jgi:uncharacterized membrane protein